MKLARMVAACGVFAWCLNALPVFAQQAQALRSGEDLEQLIEEKAGFALELPELSFSWADEGFIGDRESGSLASTHSKVIYYFVHWGPTEVEEIDEAYVRQRIPKVWPGEGLEVQKVKAATVAGHPALFAEVMPRRQFYRAFFLIWNCPETGRQFIADMNYNVAVKTPRAELEAEFETTRKTLSCHPGTPVSHLPTHPVRYDNPRYGLSFEHPPHWHVYDNPYGVPHPAYAGLRNHTVGSVLAWMQDMEVSLQFAWSPIPDQEQPSGEAMGIQLDLYKMAVGSALALDGVEDFVADEYETLSLGATPVLKVTGTAELTKPEAKGQDFVPKSRLMMLIASDAEKKRVVTISVGIDYYRNGGEIHPPDRSIFDRWAVEIAKGLEL
ncbi:MAG: hypothetical protein GY906_15170 [bacterium]|nr:hypothetical protein [bacterium]